LAGGIPVLRPAGAKKTQSQDSISKQEVDVVSSERPVVSLYTLFKTHFSS
jgi:hypothetical protein